MPLSSETSALPPGFDADFYQKTYPDVALSGLTPERHYLHYGQILGRKTQADPGPPLTRRLMQAAALLAPGTSEGTAPAAAVQDPAASGQGAPGGDVTPGDRSARLGSARSGPGPAGPSSAGLTAGAARPSVGAGSEAAAAPDSGETGLSPDILDLLYARGPIPAAGPLRHAGLVTIILPSYNNASWLARAIHAALSQTGVQIELIVVDDGSTDASVSVARRIADGAGAGRMQVISLLRNFGCYYARNIGLCEARGDYITVLDSDDIIAPGRLERQLDVLAAHPEAMACQCRGRRWTADFRLPLTEVKYGENGLLWKRAAMESLGYYDSTRYASDSEFRNRLKRRYGDKSVIQCPDELYFLRTLTTSLTADSSTGMFRPGNGQLETSLSQARQSYEQNFLAWQRSSPAGQPGGRISFPQFSRPFPLGEAAQNASPALGQRRVGAMASFPPRREGLQKAIASILPQLDELILYLNDYPDVPEFLNDPRIRVVRSQQARGDLRDNGKFYDLPQQDAYIFTLDDDLLYPPDYVARMVHQIEMLGRSAVVGVHGVIFPPVRLTNLRQRLVWHFAAAHQGGFVDLLGTGTTAWHASALRPVLEDFRTSGVCDLWFMALANRAQVPFYSVPRPANWIRVVGKFDETLFAEAERAPEAFFQRLAEARAALGAAEPLRLQAERALATGYDADTLEAAGIRLGSLAGSRLPGPGAVRPLALDRSPGPLAGDVLPRAPLTEPPVAFPGPAIRFHLVVNGWNCRGQLDACLRSVAQQLPGPFDCQVTLIDDGSDDGTAEKLAGLALLPEAKLIRVVKNTGPAYARHIGIRAIRDPETVVVLLDMDDALAPQALRRVAQVYLEDPACLMTIGNWIDQYGKMNPQPFYTAEDINRQKVRQVEQFNATHLRTFRRRLYDAVTEADLTGPDGRWLETCTDVALMYPLLDQCWADEIRFLPEPLYLYNRQLGSGTLARFGKSHKVERLAYLKSRPPKPRLSAQPPRRRSAA